MNKFYVITNETKDADLKITNKVRDYILSLGGKCLLCVEGHRIENDVDCILVLGGDGTFIRSSREYHKLGIPMIGINIGTLGYLTEIELGNLEDDLKQLMRGKYISESRMMLEGVLNDTLQDVALNDIVLGRHSSVRIIRFALYVNGQFLNSYRADGLIVSTPTGSTAYNLSAGGPIVEPTASMIVLTPICSHALNTSSICLSAEDEILLVVEEGRDGGVEEAMLSFDGENNIVVHTGDRIVIRKSKDITKIVKLSEIGFLETVHRKMKGN